MFFCPQYHIIRLYSRDFEKHVVMNAGKKDGKGWFYMAELIAGAVFVFLTVICFIYGISAWNYRGPVLMNKYLLASAEEKRALARQPEEEKKADYRYAAKISFGIAFMWFFAFLGIIADLRLIWISVLTAFVLAVYALSELFRNNRN